MIVEIGDILQCAFAVVGFGFGALFWLAALK